MTFGSRAVPIHKQVLFSLIPLRKVVRIADQLHFDVTVMILGVLADRRPDKTELLFRPDVFIGGRGTRGGQGGEFVNCSLFSPADSLFQVSLQIFP